MAMFAMVLALTTLTTLVRLPAEVKLATVRGDITTHKDDSIAALPNVCKYIVVSLTIGVSIYPLSLR